MNEPRIQKLNQIPLLLDIYGSLLTERQREAISLFYEEDLSLSEIASLHGSTRQAAYSLIERGEMLLRDYESRLQLVAAEQHRSAVREQLLQRISAAPLSAAEKHELEDLLCQL